MLMRWYKVQQKNEALRMDKEHDKCFEEAQDVAKMSGNEISIYAPYCWKTTRTSKHSSTNCSSLLQDQLFSSVTELIDHLLN